MDKRQELINTAIQAFASMITQKLDILMVVAKEAGNATDSLAAAMATAMVGIKGAAHCTMKQSETNEPTVQHMLFSALLVAACNDCDGDGGHPMEISEETILKAFDDYERLTGRKPDSILNPSFVEWARSAENINLPQEQKTSLSKFFPPSPGQH